MTQLRIVLVDDHTLFRKGLAELLEREGAIHVAAITGNPADVSGLLRSHAPDVLRAAVSLLAGLDRPATMRAETILADGLHPTESGQILMGLNLARLLAPLVEERL